MTSGRLRRRALALALVGAVACNGASGAPPAKPSGAPTAAAPAAGAAAAAPSGGAASPPSATAAAPAEMVKVRGAWVAETANQMIWPTAKEAGYFDKYGVDFD